MNKESCTNSEMFHISDALWYKLQAPPEVPNKLKELSIRYTSNENYLNGANRRKGLLD